MIVKCKHCGVSYNFQESLLIDEGVWLRCTNCRFVFFLPNPSWNEQPDEQTETGHQQGSFPSDGVLVGREAKKNAGKVARRLILGLLAIVFFAALVAALLIVPTKQVAQVEHMIKAKLDMVASKYLLKTKEPFPVAKPQQVANQQPFLLPANELKTIEISAGRQKLFGNAKTGYTLIKNGKIINKSGKALQNVLIEGALISKNGMVLKTALSICGNIVADNEIKSSKAQSITAFLLAKGNNTIVSNEQELPFLLVFFDNSKSGNSAGKGFKINILVREAQQLP